MITLRPGEIFQGRYRLIEPLGEGAYSQVWRAIQITLSRPVVIKIMRENLVGKHPQLVKRFLQEAQILASINHRNIVRVLDADVVDGRPYFVMDFVEGRDLHHVLIGTPEYRLLPLEVADTMEAVLHGLIEAHGLGVIHLDLKPENVLVGDDGISRLIDFGIALMTEDGAPRQTRGTMGTPGYMAPEILSSRLTAGPTTDIFAAGVMLFVLCGGRLDLPNGQGIADLSRSEVRDGYLATLRGEYAPFTRIIRRATTYEQDNRYASADEMLGAITQARRTIERAQPAPQGAVGSGARRSTPILLVSPAPAAEEGEATTGRAPTAVPAPVVASHQTGSRLIDAPPTRASDDPFMTREYVPPSFPWKYVVAPVIFFAAAFIVWLVWPSGEAIEPVVSTPVADEQPVVDPGEATVEPVLSTPTPSGSETPPILPAGGGETASEPPAVPIAKIDAPPAPAVKTTVKSVAAPVAIPVPPDVKTPPALPAGGEEIAKPPPVPVPTVVAFNHTPISTCAAAGHIEAHGPPGSVVKMRYRPFDPAIWQDPKSLREEAPGTFALTFGCTGDHATGFDYYLEATPPGGTKQKAGSASAPFKVQ